MKPQTPGPWRKTLRSQAKGVPHRRAPRQPEPDLIRRGSTWIRRHRWMPTEELRAIYADRCLPRGTFIL